jgi:hypothetical protein
VIGEIVIDLQRVLADRPDPFSSMRNAGAGAGMGVGDAIGVGPRLVDAAVDGEAGIVEPALGPITLPSMSILTRLDAVISSNISP